MDMMDVVSKQSMLTFLVRLMIILLINPLHEYAHAWTAYKLGDDTAEKHGRMTLSPLAHVDGLGALLLLFFGFGWAKPVSVTPSKFKKPRLGMLITAIAGPFTNLLAALAGVVAFQLCDGSTYFEASPDSSEIGSTMYYAAWMLWVFTDVNLNLFLFNLIPVPPLDGSRVLMYFLPSRAAFWMIRNQRIIYGVMMILLFLGVIDVPLVFLNNLLHILLLHITDWLPVVV